MRQKYTLSPFIFNIVLEILSRELMREKNKKQKTKYPTWKRRGKIVIICK